MEEKNPLNDSIGQRAYCTGTAISATHVLTAGHCIQLPENTDGKTYQFPGGIIKVRTQDGQVFEMTIGKSILDPDEDKNGMDAAILISATPVFTKIAVLGDSDTVQQGDFIVIVGNSYGMMTYSFAPGYVSFVNRQLPSGVYIQAVVESRGGNSGGPAFNEKGEVVGILVRSDRAGISFIVPINLAIRDLTAQSRKP
jgi:S1-C subfamily serine protease